jgi:hypothetical protein
LERDMGRREFPSPWNSPPCSHTNMLKHVKVLTVLVAVCDQKILVFVLQMEKSKQSMWMGWGRIALLREEVACPARWGKGSRKKKAWWAKVESDSQERAFLFQVPLKPIYPMGGEAQEVPTQ